MKKIILLLAFLLIALSGFSQLAVLLKNKYVFQTDGGNYWHSTLNADYLLWETSDHLIIYRDSLNGSQLFTIQNLSQGNSALAGFQVTKDTIGGAFFAYQTNVILEAQTGVPTLLIRADDTTFGNIMLSSRNSQTILLKDSIVHYKYTKLVDTLQLGTNADEPAFGGMIRWVATDGDDGYMYYTTSDRLETSGINSVNIKSGQLYITSGYGVYFDGGDNTYIRESSADKLDIAAGGNIYRYTTTGIINDSTIIDPNTLDVADDDSVVLSTGVYEVTAFSESGDYLKCIVVNGVIVGTLSTNGNVATTNSDSNLCIYKSPSNAWAIVRNRLGVVSKITIFTIKQQ